MKNEIGSNYSRNFIYKSEARSLIKYDEIEKENKN